MPTNAAGDDGATAEADASASATPNARMQQLAETVLDGNETIVDDDLLPIYLSGDIAFDAASATVSQGRIAACVQGETFTIHTSQRIGSGSQGIVVAATDTVGNAYAAKITLPPTAARDRRNRRAVLDCLLGLMDDHPLGANHYKQTHLMPLYAYGQIAAGSATAPPLPSGVSAPQHYDVAIMALAEGSLDAPGGAPYEALRDTIIPQTAEGLRALHAQGIVHRDIKPKNLYLLGGQIVLGDYGISSLLDEGRDTGATVFDKRTPGYSPHSSVVQRENDWYALGYTIWTLYNGGEHPHQALIDAGDLSAVLAGKHPVKFIARRPEEESLGQLIYGLTLETARGRLGYADVQAWLEDPANFRFDNPFDRTTEVKSYQFNGQNYTTNESLALAMAACPEQAQDHISSQLLERHLADTGQHDLAVKIHHATSEDEDDLLDARLGLWQALTLLRGSASEFCWEGEWRVRAGVADALFARITETPARFYETCVSEDELRDLYRYLLAAFAGAPSSREAEGRSNVASLREAAASPVVASPREAEALVRAAYTDFIDHPADDTLLRGDKLLTLFDLICDDARPVRRFFRDYGIYGDAVWMRRHSECYLPRTDSARSALKDLKACSLPDPTDLSLEALRAELKKLDAAANALTPLLPQNPFYHLLGMSEGAEVEIARAEAYRIARAFGETCTIAFARELMPCDQRDSVCEFAALKTAATHHAKREATAIREAADEYQPSASVAGHSKAWHVVLMVAIAVVWFFGIDAIAMLGEECADRFGACAPYLVAGGGFTLDNLMPGFFAGMTDLLGETFTSCTLATGLTFLAFTACAICVLGVRIAEFVPVAFTSYRTKRAEENARRVAKIATKLDGLSLERSLELLFSGEKRETDAEIRAARKVLSERARTYGKAEALLARGYLIGFVALALGIIGMTVCWTPYFGYVGATIVDPVEFEMSTRTAQIALIVGYAIYFFIVLRKSEFEPNMIAVVFALAALAVVTTAAPVFS